MPIVNAPSNASSVIVAGMPVLFNTLTFVGAGTQFTGQITTDGLPVLNLWLMQTSLLGSVVTVIPQFADGVTIAGLPNWQPLIPAFGIVLNVPSLTNYKLGSRLHRLSITSTGVAVVMFRMVGSIS